MQRHNRSLVSTIAAAALLMLSTPIFAGMKAAQVHVKFKKVCASKNVVTGCVLGNAVSNDNISSEKFTLKPGYCKKAAALSKYSFDILVPINARPTRLEFRILLFGIWSSQSGQEILVAHESDFDRSKCQLNGLLCISIEELVAGPKVVPVKSDDGDLELELSSDGTLNYETYFTVLR